ncbi:MAG: MCE family protein, partial [Ruminococcus sp.]|nr:MCE family protein [Ruminococcus sp.]
DGIDDPIGEVSSYKNENGTITATIIIDQDYDGELSFTAYDNVGNCSDELSVKVQNDVTEPEIADKDSHSGYFNYDEQTYFVNTTLNFTASDVLSGISGIEYYFVSDVDNPKANWSGSTENTLTEDCTINNIGNNGSFEFIVGDTDTYTITFSGDVTGTLFLRSVDNAGNTSVEISYTIYNCDSTPELSITTNQKTAGSSIDREGDDKLDDVTVNDSGTDNSGWFKDYSFTVTAAETNHGHSMTLSYCVVEDTEENRGTLFEYNEGWKDVASGAITYKDKTIAKVEYVASSTISEYTYEITLCDDFCGNILFTCVNNTTEITTDENLFNKVSTLGIHIQYDKTEPAFTEVSSSTETEWSSETTITLVAEDQDTNASEISEIASIKYEDGSDDGVTLNKDTEIDVDGIDDPIGKVSSYKNENGTITAVITIDADYDGKLSFTAYDNAGNSTDTTVTVQNDVTDPEFTATSDSKDQWLSTTTIELEAEDTNFDYSQGKDVGTIASIKYDGVGLESGDKIEVNGREIGYVKDYSIDGTTIKATIIIDKDYDGKLSFTAYDNAGNSTDTSVTVYNDITAPTVSGTIPTVWDNDTEFTVTATDNATNSVYSGIETIEYKLDNS